MEAGGRVLARRDMAKTGSAPDIGHFHWKAKIDFKAIKKKSNVRGCPH